jgi:hypothetical protein
MRTAWKTTQELQNQGRGEPPGLDPNPIAWGEGEQADTKLRGVLETSSLQQPSNPTNCCLRLRFIRLSSLSTLV